MTLKRLVPLAFIIAVLLTVALRGSGTIPRAAETSNALHVDFLDIGQGDSILLTTPHRQHILIDGGPDSSVLSQLGQNMHFNEHTIDLVVVSHNHADHITGLNAVLPRYDVKKMWISGAIHTTNEYLKMLQNIKAKNIPTEVVWKGTTMDIDGVHLDVAHPLIDMTGQRPEDQHDATVVVRATFGTTSFLFTGDLNEDHEQAMVDSGETLQADVLKVPHHGSATGLLPAFVDKVAPKYAVIQVGAGNKFGHPTQSALHKLEDRHIKTFRNDLNGTVHAVSDGTTVTVTAER